VIWVVTAQAIKKIQNHTEIAELHMNAIANLVSLSQKNATNFLQNNSFIKQP
jgi:hypothetical protein